MNYPPYQPRQEPARAEPQSVTVPKGRDDYPDDGCPECGYVPQDSRDAEKHGIMHYGDMPLRDLSHQNIVARQRQALLRGWEIPRT